MCPRVLHRTPSCERLTYGTCQVGDDPDAGDAGRPPLGPLRRGDPPPPPASLSQLETKNSKIFLDGTAACSLHSSPLEEYSSRENSCWMVGPPSCLWPLFVVLLWKRNAAFPTKLIWILFGWSFHCAVFFLYVFLVLYPLYKCQKS